MAPIFSVKGRGCFKGVTSARMLMRVPSDALLYEQRSAEFTARQRIEAEEEEG